MGKLGATGSRFQEVLARANTVPTYPPDNPMHGQVHNEGDRWWRFSTAAQTGLHPKDAWLPFEPTQEDRNNYILSMTVSHVEDMEKIAAAVKKGMLLEARKAINLWANPPQLAGSSGTYETGVGWSTPAGPMRDHEFELTLEPSLPKRAYDLALDVAPIHVGDPLLFTTGYIPEETIEAKAESVKVYGQWMRVVGEQLAVYCVHQHAESQTTRGVVLGAYEKLCERGVVVDRYDWMDHPELADQVARAIASIQGS